MNTKLSPIEELRAKRIQLKQECADQEAKLSENLFYLKDNFGSLLFASTLNSSKNAISSLFSGSENTNGGYGTFFNKAFSVAPIIWNIAQPLLIGVATRKVKNFLFGQKKKK